MRIGAGVLLLLVLAARGSAAQTPLDGGLRAAAALQAAASAATPSLALEDPGYRLALPVQTTHQKHALGETLLIVGAGAVVVGAVAGGGGGTVLILGGVACAAYGVYLLQL
jgi:hypothetical protein